MTTTQQPEALNLEEFRAKVTRAAREPLLARIEELESQLAAIGAGGVEPLRKQAEGVLAQTDHATELAPPNSLPTFDECALRVENSNFLEKRAAGGGYGPEHDSRTATQLHRFIYEYDDADPVRSSWFLHRLELLLNEVRSASQPAAQGWKLVQIELLERIQESLGSFISDQGWSQSDMDTADALGWLLATAPQRLAQKGWCDGCSPDNCCGCGPAAPTTPNREHSHD